MIDVGTLLRTISKSEDYDIPEIANYLSTYKVFSERVSSIINATVVDGGSGGEHSDDGMRSVRLPDGYSQIFRSYVFGLSGLKDYGSATLHCKI